MNLAVKMGAGSDLSEGPLKFYGIEVELQDKHLLCHQRQYLRQKVSSALLPAGTEIEKTMVRRGAGIVGWIFTMTCLHDSLLVCEMRVSRMDLETLYIAANSDLSLAKKIDLSSQISVLVLFRDRLGNAAISQY